MKKIILLFAFLAMLTALGGLNLVAQEDITLFLGSWRVDDSAEIGRLLRPFEEANPHINIIFDPTNPPDYNQNLQSQFESGTAPDLMYLRSFTTARGLFDAGYLANLSDLEPLETNFSSDALAAWSTEDNLHYGLPLMAVSHGIYYNQNIFDALEIAIPQTWEELLSASETIQDKGYAAFANGSADTWTIAELVFMALAPNYIGGREGRLAYLNGERCFDDEHVVAAFQAVAELAPHFPPQYAAISDYDAHQLFVTGQAAMYMGGSWDISTFEQENPDFAWSIFAIPAPAGQETFVTFHLDAAIGMNAATEHPEEARLFLEWMSQAEFGANFGDELPGFFPLHLETPSLRNEHAASFLGLNEGRGTDIRWAWEGLLEGSPSGYDLMQENALAVLSGAIDPETAAQNLQAGLAEWFEPAQSCEA